MKILFYSPNTKRQEQWIAGLISEGLEFTPVRWKSGSGPCEAEIAVVWLPEEELFQTQTNLKVVFNVGAGADGILKVKSLPKHIDIVRLEDPGMAKIMAEYVVHAIADISRSMATYRDANKHRTWTPAPYRNAEDWPVGVMGLGVVGRAVSQALNGLGYSVFGWARTARNIEGVRCYAGEPDFEAFLSRSRVLVNALPLTHETENVLNKKTLSSLLPDSYVINIGRGEHLDEADLLEMLANGNLAGAVLDVFRKEPLPADHPFWSLPAIRITPHISGATNLEVAMQLIARNIRAFMNAAPLIGLVDRRAGY